MMAMMAFLTMVAEKTLRARWDGTAVETGLAAELMWELFQSYNLDC